LIANAIVVMVVVNKMCEKHASADDGQRKKPFSKFRGGEANLEYRGKGNDDSIMKEPCFKLGDLALDTMR